MVSPGSSLGTRTLFLLNWRKRNLKFPGIFGIWFLECFGIGFVSLILPKFSEVESQVSGAGQISLSDLSGRPLSPLCGLVS
jgi:hypothetical protein